MAGRTAAGIKPVTREPTNADLLCKRVLIVEDSRALRYMMATLLKGAVADLQIASNGHEALLLIHDSIQKADPFSVIFMDMEMPGMNGFDATEYLRRQGIEIPVIAITGKTSSTDRDKCLGAGCTDFLPKPVSKEKLLQAVIKHSSA